MAEEEVWSKYGVLWSWDDCRPPGGGVWQAQRREVGWELRCENKYTRLCKQIKQGKGELLWGGARSPSPSPEHSELQQNGLVVKSKELTARRTAWIWALVLPAVGCIFLGRYYLLCALIPPSVKWVLLQYLHEAYKYWESEMWGTRLGTQGSIDASQLRVHSEAKRVVRLKAELRAEISLKFWGGGGFEANGVRMTRRNKRWAREWVISLRTVISSSLQMRKLRLTGRNWVAPGCTAMAHTPVLFPGKSHGRRSLVAALHGVAKSRTHWATSLSLFTFMHWRRKWQPTPVFLPEESQGWGSLMGCCLWGHRVGHDWSDLATAALPLMC